MNELSVWEFLACLDGWKEAHGTGEAEEAEPMSVEAMRAAGIVGV